MTTRRKAGNRKVPKRKTVNSIELLRKALNKQTKADLIKLVTRLAKKDRTLQRTLEANLNIEAPAVDLVVATRQAIIDATVVDEGQLNHNFDYDYQAYETVGRNLKRLMKAKQWDEAMELAAELMSKGSYQMEMSDEGAMIDDIQECLQPVIKALRKSGLPNQNVHAWCKTMLAKDRIGCVCDEELADLQNALGCS